MKTRKVAVAKFDLSETLTEMLEEFATIVVTKKIRSTNFTTRNKVFAFTKGKEAVVLKLPPDAIERILLSKKASLLIMGKRTMKEWVLVPCKSAHDCKKLLGFFKEGIVYVSSLKINAT